MSIVASENEFCKNPTSKNTITTIDSEGYGSIGGHKHSLDQDTPVGFVVTFTETFSTNIGGMLNLQVWADNTAAVVIDGMTVFYANFTSDAYCAAGPIGCEAGEPGIISHTFQDSGIHTLSFDVYQGGDLDAPPGNPFGLLYSGTLTAIPIPPAIWLLGSGLLGLIGVARKKAA